MKIKNLLILLIRLLLVVMIAVFTISIVLYIYSENRHGAKMAKILPIINSKEHFFNLLSFKLEGKDKNEIDDSLVHYSPSFRKILEKDNVDVYVCLTETKQLSCEVVLIIKYEKNTIEDFYCFLIDYKQSEFYFISTFNPDAKTVSIKTENSIWSSPVREKLFVDKMLELIKDKKVETLYSQALSPIIGNNPPRIVQ